MSETPRGVFLAVVGLTVIACAVVIVGSVSSPRTKASLAIGFGAVLANVDPKSHGGPAGENSGENVAENREDRNALSPSPTATPVARRAGSGGTNSAAIVALLFSISVMLSWFTVMLATRRRNQNKKCGGFR
ncbi:MAG TPA: hypothetical protein VEZ90_10155 [Blastocatellia bacterium]|nr:hypothetical protein [Blastocatellia bacterium]